MSVKRPQKLPAFVERIWPLIAVLIFLAAVSLLASAVSAELARATTSMLINVIIVVGLYVFIGNSGVPSFGHTAFMAVGAYAGALLAMQPANKELLLPGLPHWLVTTHMAPVPAILVGGLCAAALAGIVGVPIARMSPLAASLGTFAVLIIVNNIVNNLQAVGGSSGLSAAPAVINNPIAYLWAAAAITLAFLYQRTRWCLRLRASREDEPAAQSVGVAIAKERFLSLVLSAFVCGVGGGVFALNLGFFTPNEFYLSAAFLVLVMLLVGGSTSLAGAVVGVVSIFVVQQVLKHVESGTGLTGIENVVVAVLLIVVMITRPLGIMGGKEVSWPFSRRLDDGLSSLAPPGATGLDDPASPPESAREVVL